MHELAELIQFWETTQQTQEWLWSAYQLEQVIKTINALEELKKLTGEE